LNPWHHRRPFWYLGAALPFYSAALVLLLPPLDRVRSARLVLDEVRRTVAPASEGGMIDFRAQFGFHYGGRMDSARPGDREALERLARRLEGSRPFWVLLRRKHLPSLEAALDPGSGVRVVWSRGPGPEDYVAVANRAAAGKR
ncbi:MAG: hypothetical protein D6718_06865, partial [Acidobacteria bacterium]